MIFNIWTFLFQVANFAVLAYVLHRLLYRPLHDAIDQRRKANEEARAEAEKARQDAAALQLQVQTQLTAMEQTRQEMIRQARGQAEKERAALLAEAEKAAQIRREELQQALVKDRTEALQALKSEVVGMAVDLTQRLLQEATDTSLQHQFALRLVEALQQLPEPERAELRTRWQPTDGVILETAAVLDNGMGEQITSAVAGVLGKTVPPAVHVKPELLGGMRLRIGGHVWDASVAGRLEEARLSKDGRATAEGAGS
jgi:F-type H+-transporting ATPase subunit b